ncbi:MAG: Rrf2 family transcriptional regulator [Planctomycetes bacterium]|nr:Rrf2 family transcriptional regulator [Planctomycetota bacterium]
MLSATAQYALRALVYIAAHDADGAVLARDIAAKTGVPLQYLSRILHDAVCGGLLESSRGVGGGFRLARPRKKIKLIDILSRFDDVFDRAKCPFGQARCSNSHPRGFHDYWKPISTAYREMLENTTLDDVGIEGLGGFKK